MPIRPVPPHDKKTELRFPYHGVDLSQGFNFQPPGTTPTGVNVRAFEPGTARMRGGQRPGLSKYISSQIPVPGLIQDLNVIVGTGYTPPAPSTGPYIVQSSAGGTGTGSSTSDSFAGGTTTGNSIIVLAGSSDGAHPFPSSVSDGTNTFTRIHNSSVSSAASSIWLAANITGTAGSITVTWPGSGGTFNIFAVEVAKLTGVVDTSSAPTGVGTSGVGIGFATTNAPDYAIGCLQHVSGNVNQTAGSWTPLKQGGKFWVGFKLVPATATIGGDLAWSFSTNDFWAACLKALKATA